jgi:uncharacterized membrane protein
MRIARIVLFIAAIVVIIGQITVIEFNEPEWKSNSGSYLSIISMLLLIALVILTEIESRMKK